MPHSPSTLFRVAPRVVSRVVQGKALVLDPERDEIQQLNAVGSYVWAILSSRAASLEELAQEVAREFEVEPTDAARDVLTFLDQLVARELLLVVNT